MGMGDSLVKDVGDVIMGRGTLTDEAKKVAKKFLGREITVRELRLLPYIQYKMTNDQRLDPGHVNQEEREVLWLWKDAGYVEGGASSLSITKEFWDFMCEVLWLTYVAYEETSR